MGKRRTVIMGFAKSETSVIPIPAKINDFKPFSKCIPTAICETVQRIKVSIVKCLRIFFIAYLLKPYI